MVADDAAERHERQTADPIEHREWIEQLPTRAAAALTAGQLKSWPPAALWRRLTMLDNDLLSRAKHVAAALADRLYPHADSTACRRPPSGVQLAQDTGLSRPTVYAALAELEERGWIERDERDGQAAHLRLTVPVDLVRADGVIEELAKRTEGRLHTAEPVKPVDRSPPEPDPDPEPVTAEEAEPDKPVDIHLSSQLTPQQRAAMPKRATTGGELKGRSLQDAREDKIGRHDDALAKLVDVFTAESGERPRVVDSSLRHRDRYPSCRVSGCPRRQFGVDLCLVHEGEEIMPKPADEAL